MKEHHEYLSDMSTSWTLFFQAMDGPTDQVKEARRCLLEHYHRPVYRYLLASVGRPDVADELYQDFALRFIRGDFQRAHPDRGRFRYYLKAALRNMITDYHRRQKHQPAPLPAEEIVGGGDSTPESAMDQEYLTSWQAELLTRTWDALKRYEEETGKPFYTILHYRTEHPELTSEQMAEQFSARLAQPVTANWIRKRLHYAREKYADLLIGEVLLTLESPDQHDLEEELQDLGLLHYCQAALQRYGQKP